MDTDMRMDQANSWVDDGDGNVSDKDSDILKRENF